MASPGPALSHLTMLSCTAPHRSSASTPCPRRHPSLCALLHHRPPPRLLLLAPATHSVFPHGSILLLCHHHPHPSAPTCPGSLCHLHGLVEPSLPSLSPPRSPVYPGALSLLAHSGSSCPQDPPPTPPPASGAPSVPAVSAAAAFSSLCTFLFPCGPFSGRNGTFPRSSSRESRREQDHNQETEESEVVRG